MDVVKREVSRSVVGRFGGIISGDWLARLPAMRVAVRSPQSKACSSVILTGRGSGHV